MRRTKLALTVKLLTILSLVAFVHAAEASDPPGSAASSSSSKGLGRVIGENEVAVIEAGGDSPGVMIGSRVYSLNDEAFGGKIIKITDEKITIKFKDKEKNYKVGDLVENK